MPLSRDQWRAIYNMFNPQQRLEATDRDLFVERPDSTSQAIVEEIELEPKGKWVLCGSMGSGKSSELVHLSEQLGRRTHATIGVDLTLSSVRVDLLTPPEVLFLIGAAVVRSAEELWNQAVPPAKVDALLGAFSGLLDPQGHAVNLSDLLQGVALFGANLLAPGAAAVAGAAQGAAKAASSALGKPVLLGRKKPQLGGLTRRLNEGEPDVVALEEAVNDILRHLAGSVPIAILVDGLDKMQNLEAIRDLFATTRILCSPEVPIIYSAPITLMLAAEWQGAGSAFKRERLSNVLVKQPVPAWAQVKEGRIAAGRAALRDVIARRLHRLSLTIEQVFAPEALELIITRSGGLLRDLVQFANRAIRWMLHRDKELIDLETAEAALEDLRKEYEITLNALRTDELRYVRAKGETSGGEVSKELLLWGYVLPYSNGKVWFEPHPILEGSRPGL